MFLESGTDGFSTADVIDLFRFSVNRRYTLSGIDSMESIEYNMTPLLKCFLFLQLYTARCLVTFEIGTIPLFKSHKE